MSTVLYNKRVLVKDTAQAVFYNKNDDGAIVTVRLVNRGSDATRIAIAITNSTALPTNLGEYIDHGTIIEPKGTYEITSLIVPAGFYIVAYSTRSSVSVMTSGFATGEPGSDATISTATPTTVTGTGLTYHYDPSHLFGLDTFTGTILPDIEKTTNMSGAGTPTYLSGPKTYSYNGVTQWWTSTDTDMPRVSGLQASAGLAWTLEAWFKFPVTPSGVRTGNQSWAICSKGGGIGGGETFTLFVGSATDTSLFPSVPYYCYVGVFGSKTQISPGPVNDNTWRQVAITWNGTSGNVYLNGAVGSALNVGTAGYQTNTWTIGSAGNGSPVMAFEGEIGPIRVYNRALSAGEILNNFDNDRTRFGI